ncbi:MAG: PAS domain S-box protein, partial [Methanoregula sp.]|nr:PAS domain S-box protein [Methanoregula sp.]
MMAEKIRVLYVDDEPLLLEVGKQFLEKSGDFAVTTATSAPDAIRLLEQETFDTIVSDYQMPEMDGIEFLKQIKAEGNTTPFIIITGKGYEKVVIAALNAGADGYFQKSGDPKLHFAELSQKIKKAVKSRRMEKALVESEENLRSLFQILPVGITILDKNRNIVNVNPALEQILSFSKDELMRGDHRQRRHIRSDGTPMPPEEYASSRAISEQTVVSGIETGVVKEDGSIIWTSVSAAPLTGNELSAVIVTTGITERKQAEETLREREEKYRTLIEALNEGIWVIDKDAVTTYVNPKMAEILGYTVEEITGRSLFVFMDDEGRRICERNIERRQQGIKEQHGFEFLKKDGTRIYASLETSPIKGKDGEYLGAIAGVMDITERKRALEALRDSEEQYRRLFEGVPVGRYRTTPSGQILDINPALVRLLGYPDRKSLLGVSVPDLYMHPGERNRWLALIEREGIVRDFEVQFRKYDGTIIWVRDTGEAVRDASDQVIYFNGNVEDITERKRVEKMLRESEAYYRTIFENTGTAS